MERENYKYLQQMGARLHSLRMKRGISKAYIHRVTGFAVSCITDIERGKKNPHLLTLMQIAAVLEVDITDFI